MMGLTKQQRACWEFVRAHHAEHGRCPTIQAIVTAMKLRSKSGGHRLMQGLVARGYLTHRPNVGYAVRPPVRYFSYRSATETFEEVQ
jgi:SOS-response transcriptional repressor LexA